MSYCRFSQDSDIYVYGAKNKLVCCQCKFDKDYETSSYTEMIVHCVHHIRDGDKVKDVVFERLMRDAFVNGCDKYDLKNFSNIKKDFKK